MPGRLNDKVAIITGGSTGIGKGIAKIFAGEGAKVAICARDEKMLDDALKEISSESVIAVKCDVTKSADVKNLINTTIENFGKLNVLVNNAGKNPVRQFTIEDATEEEWDQFQAINAKGSFLASKYAIPELRKSGGGSIIMISSISANIGQANVAVYLASDESTWVTGASFAIDGGYTAV